MKNVNFKSDLTEINCSVVDYIPWNLRYGFLKLCRL
jgi:hypothetical protein